MPFPQPKSLFFQWRIATFIVLILIQILSTLSVNAQEKEEYTVFRYTSKNGLPQNSIKSLVMDKSRYLWMSTESGIVRFDGSQFKIYNHINTEGITNDRFRNILSTGDGRIVTDESSGNVFEITDGRIKQIRKSGVEKSTGSIIYGGTPNVDYFLKMYENRFPFNSISNNYLFYFIFPLKNNIVAIRTDKIIRYYDQNKLLKQFDLNAYNITEHFLLENRIYFFNSNNDLFYVDFDNGTVKQAYITGINSKLLKSTHLHKNVIWNYAAPEVYLKLGNKFFVLNATNSPDSVNSKLKVDNLPENCFILSALYDKKSNNLFIGTDSKGLYIYKKNFFTVTLSNDSTNKNGNSFYSLFEVDSNHVFAGFDREFSISGIKKSRYAFGSITTECIIKDKNNHIYFANDKGLFKYDSANDILLNINPNDKNEYHCFYEDGDSILVGSKHGIAYIKNNNYIPLADLTENKFNYRIEDIIRGPDGNIWIADCIGVSRYDSSTRTILKVTGLQNICSRAFFKHDSVLLIGTYGDGYLAWANNKIIKFPLDKNRYLTHVHSFSIDKNFNMWMSTNKGLLRTSFTNTLKYINQPSERISYYYYGEDDGILNTEFNGGCSPPLVKLKNGYSVYPTLEGLVWFIPENLPEMIPNEVILIDEIRVDGKRIPLTDKIVIPSKHENIEFRFSTPYWGNVSSLDIDYQLVGFNKNRNIISGMGNSIVFSSLHSGFYELRIRKLNHTDDDAIIEVILPFIVEKKFYETFPFIILSLIAGLLAFITIINLNTRRINQKNISLEEKIKERTNELQATNIILQHNNEKLAYQEKFLKESIKVKDKLVAVISHDIITPLKFISMVSRISKKNKDNIDRVKLLESLGDIEFAADKLHNNATNILNWMKLQNNRIIARMSHIAIHELIEECIEPMIGMAELRRISIENLISEEEIIQSDRYILSIILQNMISNAIKYTEQGTVSISAEIKNEDFLIMIADTGIGFSGPTLQHIENTLAGNKYPTNKNETWYLENGLGYSIIADLLPHIKGTVKIKSEPGKGSVVIVTIPYN